jgi:TPR repeat protein
MFDHLNTIQSASSDIKKNGNAGEYYYTEGQKYERLANNTSDVDIRKEHYRDAFKYYETASKLNYIKAKTSMASFYLYAIGGIVEDTSENKKKGFELLKETAGAGHLRAKTNLSICYEEGRGTEQDWLIALYWYMQFKKEADANPSVYDNMVTSEDCNKRNKKLLAKIIPPVSKNKENELLGNLYYRKGQEYEQKAISALDGTIKKEHYKDALNFHEFALELGCITAKTSIATFYLCGLGGIIDGTLENKKKGFELLQDAAEKGHTRAKFILAACFDEGNGTKQDLEQALYWYKEFKKDITTGQPLASSNMAKSNEKVCDKRIERLSAEIEKMEISPDSIIEPFSNENTSVNNLRL